MTDDHRPVSADDILASLTPARQARIRARGAELIAEEFALRDLRRAEELTQATVAERLGGRQVYVSRLEKRADMKLSTLRAYVRAIGGDLQLLVTFPEGRAVRLKDIGAAVPRARRNPARKIKTAE
ncbi:helix-turn-helix domain-containing protein [Methylobacterium sp. Leaf106]|uniref:helix-turn-helix domain-containing protein n=1 Tax=Methylobacterium sp. Leaf106 TaxID=1736255 RepID=UPI0006FB32D4|nr:helix-turn-helix domain-containing protein [Methylobacterium sp. Leaf106]KQP52824.1 hypothetical protein ASF34_00075 [Methylobacterium sp. Leaf106]